MHQRQRKFQKLYVRRVFYEKEWWFSVVDVIAVITESKRPDVYWGMMKRRSRDVPQSGLLTNCEKLKLEGRDDYHRPSDCATIYGIYAIIQHIPSKKAAAFKESPEAWDEEVITPDLDHFETLFYLLIAGYPR